MKKLILIFLATILISSCGDIEKKEGDFKLLPLPQEYAISGISDLQFEDVILAYAKEGDELPFLGNFFNDLKLTPDQDNAQITFSIASDLDIKAEGYTLEISAVQINLQAKDKAGLMYGFMTLGQLLQDAKEQNAYLPVCSIKDYPALAYRAIHLDVKHHLEKTSYYYSLLDKLASYKVNAIILEIEDKVKYQRQPIVGSPDALTIEEWKEISEYAHARNIEISPLVQGLGHASFVLKHEEYKDLRDDPNSDWAFNPLDPKTYEVQYDLYLDAMEAMPYGKYLHIGGDEVHTTGRNSGKSPLELQLDWLAKVCKFAAEQGKTPIFWDDMPLKHAGVYSAMFNGNLTAAEVDSIWAKNEHKLVEFLDVFPKNCIYMRWNYNIPQALGNKKAMEWFMEHDLQVMGATAGQTRWVLMPQNESNIENIKSFANSSISSGLNGLLLTLWDDDSPHFELYMRGIIAFSELTWSGDKRTNTALKSAYRQREFSNTVSDSSYAFIDALETPVAHWKNILLENKVSRNILMRDKRSKEELVITLPTKEAKGAWSKKYAKRIEQAQNTLVATNDVAKKIASVKSLATRNTYNLEVYEQVNKLVSYSANVIVALSNYDTATTDEEQAKAFKAISELSNEFNTVRNSLEKVYGETRVLTKPENYILDQDHHAHLANQTISFDWMFIGELFFLETLENHITNGGFGIEVKPSDK